jgi:hypothetical protein
MKTFIEDFMAGSRRSPYPKRTLRAPGSMVGWVGDTALLVDLADEIYLAGIHTLRSKTGCGSASKALRWLCGLADKHGFVVYLFAKANEHQTLSTAQLREWYGRNGFAKKRTWMVRQPKQKGTYAIRRA